jgi:hypothetical protein
VKRPARRISRPRLPPRRSPPYAFLRDNIPLVDLKQMSGSEQQKAKEDAASIMRAKQAAGMIYDISSMNPRLTVEKLNPSGPPRVQRVEKRKSSIDSGYPHSTSHNVKTSG